MSRSYRQALNATVTGVTIVTTRVAGRPFGETVTGLSSLSDEPPLLLVTVTPALATAIQTRGEFAANVLGDHQADLAETFRGVEPTFAARYWWPVSGGGLPRLHGAAARFECEVERVHAAGDHVLVIGAVKRAVRGATMPLAYTRQGYTAPLAA
ncbi:flavin reductase family protein [Solirubrobacter phytolaccae]|uniref:Flavin reductase family protein n=1 Tax=Solirubrobacter phytolaccae TaxID=1404360 RepID=A0A9X3SBQ9_9ACTN|nr:flavin reductase family protein [Solirubrobacter phytolaccae]MDA0183861.1 flavin reductase family protein [Solirubrobacter phytolaccae]